MASSSSRSPPQFKHDVFVSFSGKDTRNGFLSHLRAALSNKKIETFIDDQLRRGHEISPALLNAIEGSKISVIIFSKNYASSGWCLDELVKILECREEYGQFVIPVFYHIDPSHVRRQTGTFGKAFTKHEKQRGEKVPRWREALNKAANLLGFDSNVIRPEYALLVKIIKMILEKLNEMSQVDNNNLVGIESRIENIIQSLHLELTGVRKVGISGMGGVGKTTLACAVFDKVFKHFEASYCAQDVKEASKICSKWTHLQRELLFNILEDRHANVKFKSIKEKLSHKKVFIVFDDVTSFNQIEELIGDLNCLGPYSRIIITTRDRQILKNSGVDKIHEITGLVDNDALRLYSKYAFKQKCPKVDFMDVTNRLVTYAQGLPLALKVLGSFLFGMTKEYWENVVNKLKRIPHGDIQKVLQVSYDELNYEDKNSFLHIVCFFRGWKRKFVEEVLDACGFDPRLGINVLIEKSLISISFGETVTMHDLIQEMGRGVVREEFISDPGKRSRLWHHDDIYHVLSQNKGTEAIQGILLDMSKTKKITLNPHAFVKMSNLRFFGVYSSYLQENKLRGFENLKYDFSELRYLYWHQYPFKLMPPNFCAMNLVALDMQYSNIEQIWNGVQDLVNLKYIDLSHCKNLFKIPDLSQAYNLERLILQGCIALQELPLSIGCLSHLKVLNLENCTRLESLPNSIGHLKSLKILNLAGCSKVERLPDDLGNLGALEVLKANGTAIIELPSSIVHSKNLRELHLPRCKVQESICLQLSGLYHLKRLYLSDCNITELPNSFGQLSSLKYIDIARNNFETIPTSIIKLSKLGRLILNNCKMLQSLPELPCCLKYVEAEGCTSLQAVRSLSILSLKRGEPFETNLNFFNCLMLDRDALRNILDDSLLNFQQKASLLLEANKRGYFIPAGGISFPGSEIPECFNIQSSGDCIVLQPGSLNHSCFGFVFCTVLAFQDFHSNKSLDVKCDISAQFGNSVCESGTTSVSCSVRDEDTAPIHIESDHVFVGYDICTPEIYEKAYNRKIHIRFRPLSRSTQGWCKVKRCGIRLLYRVDYQKSIRESSGCVICDENEEEEEGERRSKRLKISTVMKSEPSAR